MTTRCKHDLIAAACADCAQPIKQAPERAIAKNAWSGEDILFVATHYKIDMTALQLAAALKRTPVAVRTMAAKIEERGWVAIAAEQSAVLTAAQQDETLNAAHQHREAWEPNEDAIALGAGTMHEKALALGRSLYGVQSRVSKLREGV